jgi:hypothetical protein
MTWTISWSWQAPSRIACIASVEGGMAISSGLELILLESNGDIRWKVDMPFKVHAMDYNNGILAVLAAHGFLCNFNNRWEYASRRKVNLMVDLLI